MPALRLLLRTTCERCGNPVPLTSAVLPVACAACDTPAALSGSNFEWVLVPGVSARFPGEGRTLLGQAERAQVTCPACRAHVADEAIARDFPRHAVRCACGNTLAVRPIPEELGGQAWWAAFVGEQQQAKLAPSAEPVAFRCTNCGGQLLVDGTTRTPSCRHCSTRTWLPDDLWRSLRPLPRAEPFYLWVDPGWERRWKAQRRTALRWALLAAALVYGGVIAIAGVYLSTSQDDASSVLLPAFGAGWLPAWLVGAIVREMCNPRKRVEYEGEG